MFAILQHYWIPDEIVSAIRVLYDQSTSQVYIQGQLSEPFSITTPVLQGDVLALFLFILVMDYVSKRSAGDFDGGVALYSKHVTSIVSSISIDLNSSDCEQIWRCVMSGTESFLFGCIYRPRASTLNQEDSEAFKLIIKSIQSAKLLVDDKKFDSLLIAGDFNFPSVKWFNYGSVNVFGPDCIFFGLNPGELFIDTLAVQELT